MKNKNKNAANDSSVFWSTAKEFITHQLPDIRKASPNTVSAYRDSLNKYIDYLEAEKMIRREDITFGDFGRGNVKSFLDWMLNTKKYAEKTCNLRITAIHSLLEYAGYEFSTDLMSVYLEACTVKGVKVRDKPIKYFENKQMKALLLAPEIRNRTGRRNQMMLVLYYDTAARISELLEATFNQIHLAADVPYMTIFGKGRKYRNIPLMEKTVLHLKRYFSEFHPEGNHELPLFYTTTYGQKHRISNDTVEGMIKKYSDICLENGVEMPDRPHCHMIRKTRAMDLYKNGMPLSHIQQLLGHEDMSTTSGFYAFATLDTLAKSMDAANKNTSAEGKKWNDKEILKTIYRL
ncbi:tyrosine-type recombinase/integrase [Clostridium sp. C105KSO13]|uniref:tyrosine-type recombinase/integrase n=1 Tax=Clostridium sp. C105KSO13 TaxID=1776045 RepID=UPI00074061AC|nr:tyrosine-type recombinase/integrase [Clostridium sp. C105KSO13]CUX32477.1 Tyrosine recombinase XerD [Clostridium sp. C105KSO13]